MGLVIVLLVLVVDKAKKYAACAVQKAKKGVGAAAGINEAATNERVNIDSNINIDNTIDSANATVVDSTMNNMTNNMTNNESNSNGNTLDNAKDRLVPLVDGAIRKASRVTSKVIENAAKLSSGKRDGGSIERSKTNISEKNDDLDVTKGTIARLY